MKFLGIFQLFTYLGDCETAESMGPLFASSPPLIRFRVDSVSSPCFGLPRRVNERRKRDFSNRVQKIIAGHGQDGWTGQNSGACWS